MAISGHNMPTTPANEPVLITRKIEYAKFSGVRRLIFPEYYNLATHNSIVQDSNKTRKCDIYIHF
jgi:hypothetical protein